ncbi:MAG TPA: ORF6N domain-containing protein [Sulfurovum sp.]|nr:MAG: DNA-binding protein [Sulfurovum sp. 35-42-20]OYZ24402.1 MAG: DNA-binding protein [Sulfurovum sp. 16-42-52]OYZ49671.1 MAG: DNA-binding protein [Sulfurovum sp. 24-42-9]OZA61526.1 MAG: DNA-binding protein [Sulfurovum sp. 39-42-12]HQR73459.1 ORF6N domain-containing protein [Sulfurovum sp.]
MDIIKFDKIENKIIELRMTQVILDSDVAELYGVQTKDINRSVSNNPEKFPDGYLFELSYEEKQEVVKKFNHLEKLKFSPYLPKAFTERGLYMLATILKSEQATQTTLEIIDTFYKIKTLSRTVKKLSTITDKAEQKSLMQHGGELIAEILDDDLVTDESETTIELNLAVLKFKHTIKKKNK